MHNRAKCKIANGCHPKLEKDAPLFSDTYLALIKNSIGSNLFRNAFYRVHGKRQDILRDGELSCAVFVSSILHLAGLVPKVSINVRATEKDMQNAGWKKIRKMERGSVIVWAAKTFEDGESHRHIGFYVGNEKAVSNNSEKRHPIMHHWTFGSAKGEPKRKIEAVYWHPKLRMRG